MRACAARIPRSLPGDAAGDVLSETDAKGETDNTYDQSGDLVQQTDPAISINGTDTRGTYAYAYDLAGNRLTETSPYGAVTHHTYDDLGRDSSTWAYAYTSTSAQTKQETDTAYDTAGRVASTTSISGVTATYAYDGLGRTHTVACTTGDTTTYSYDLRDDALDDLTAQTGTGADATTADRHFTHSLNGRPVASAVGSTSEYYDTNALGDVLTTSGQAGSSSFTYNADESPLTRTDASGTSSYTYDTDGRLKSDTDAATGITLTSQYNALSQPKSVTYGSSGDVRNFRPAPRCPGGAPGGPAEGGKAEAVRDALQWRRGLGRMNRWEPVSAGDCPAQRGQRGLHAGSGGNGLAPMFPRVSPRPT
ncbi:hypothetical protein [Streptomyces sp. NPDC091209]|uniref:hypothetical protein n=1 Tax=Streptomyces sp. NPDC091209 TaxID=3365974 RepID=UPI0037FA283A